MGRSLPILAAQLLLLARNFHRANASIGDLDSAAADMEPQAHLLA